jgi:hypothetical protein
MLPAWTNIYRRLHRSFYILNNPGHCTMNLKQIGPGMYWALELFPYPESVDELIANMEEIAKTSILEGEDTDFRKVLNCPHSTQREVSFELFDRENLKPGIRRFIVLYEKPNIHIRSEPTKNPRTMLYNDGGTQFRSEDVVRERLLEQSMSADGFVWEWSTYNDHDAEERLGWKEAQVWEDSKTKAIIVCGVLLLIYCLLLII